MDYSWLVISLSYFSIYTKSHLSCKLRKHIRFVWSYHDYYILARGSRPQNTYDKSKRTWYAAKAYQKIRLGTNTASDWLIENAILYLAKATL